MAYAGEDHFRPTGPPTPQYTNSEHMWSTAQPRQQSAPAIVPSTVTLSMRQQPQQALATSEGKEKTRKPIDPPPIVKIEVDERADPNRLFLFSPHLFVIASLMPEGSDAATARSQKGMIGETCSAIHRLKDLDNKEGGYFVFGDISIRKPGRYRLQFSLFNNESSSAYTLIAEILSDTFNVLSSKDFHGMDESTVISRSFNEQGVRLRMRKEPRSRQVTSFQPELDHEVSDPRQHQLHNDYSLLSQQRYTPQGIYQADDRGMKRRRDDEIDPRITPAQLPRTAYYQNAYQPQTTAAHQYSSLGLASQNYPVQHMLSQSMHHAGLGQHYLNIDPDIQYKQ